MNEFQNETDYLARAQSAMKAQRTTRSQNETCAVCATCNPAVLREVSIEEDDGTRHRDWLCHNHAKLLYALNKKHFPEAASAQKAKNTSVTLPRLLVDEVRIQFELNRISESVAIERMLIPPIPEPSHEIGVARELSKVIRRQMIIDPLSPFPNCACFICGESRPIMIEVHHVDRERNSDRAVYLCANHHALVTQLQETEQPDERDIEEPEVRSFLAAHLGEGVLEEVDGSFRHAVRKLLKARLEVARAAIENASRPPEEDDRDHGFGTSCC